MPYPPKPPTGQAVSAALKHAGFNRIAPFCGAGLARLNEHAAGYKVRKSPTDPNAVEVRWLPSSLATDPMTERRMLMLVRYADALLHAGFRCQIDEPGAKLTVYARWR